MSDFTIHDNFPDMFMQYKDAVKQINNQDRSCEFVSIQREGLKAFVTPHCEGNSVKQYVFNSWPLWIFNSINLSDIFQILFSQRLLFIK